MGTTITVVGKLYTDDLKYLKNASDVTFLAPSNFWDPKNIDDFIEKAHRSDLIIIALFGCRFEKVLSDHQGNRTLQNIFRSEKIRKVCWSFDSHHCHQAETTYQSLFDHFYIAHSPYLKFYTSSPVSWLPCCYSPHPVDEFLGFMDKEYTIERDIICPFQRYEVGDRNEVIDKIRERLIKRGLRFHIGSVPYGEEYAKAMRESRICLNVSLIDDLNIRNFEAWAYNTRLLTNRVPDHDKITFDSSHTNFFQRNLTDFDEALDRALEDKGVEIRSIKPILEQHMLIHRYVEIINRELGLKLDVDCIRNPHSTS